jgi:hypothetical protein
MALEPVDVNYSSSINKFVILLHFLSLDFKTHSTRIHNWLNSYYSPHDQRAFFTDYESSYSVEIEEIGSPNALKFDQERHGIFTKFCLANAHCYYENGVFYSSATGEFAHQIEIDIRNRTMRANIGGEFIESEESFIYNVVRDVLGKLLLPLNKLMSMHGAVVTDGTRTIFLAGDKGMGKSTIALKMMESGYRILSDDSPLFTFINGKTLALSSLDELSVTENTLKLFPRLAEFVSRQREISGKYFVSRSALDQSKLAFGPLPITDFIQLNRGACDQPRLTEMNKNLVTGELIREFMSIFNQQITLPSDPKFFKRVTQFIFDTTSSLLIDARVYKLDYDNRDLDRIPDLIGSTTGFVL